MDANSDRELLELAAKAAVVTATRPSRFEIQYEGAKPWNPLTDDGDALRLASRLQISIRYGASFPACDSGASVFAKARIGFHKPDFEANQSFARTTHRFRVLESESRFAEYMCRPERGKERWLPDEGSATRRAIVRAAAEIGKAMV